MVLVFYIYRSQTGAWMQHQVGLSFILLN